MILKVISLYLHKQKQLQIKIKIMISFTRNFMHGEYSKRIELMLTNKINVISNVHNFLLSIFNLLTEYSSLFTIFNQFNSYILFNHYIYHHSLTGTL